MPLELSRRQNRRQAQISISAVSELCWVMSYLEHRRPLPKAKRMEKLEALSDEVTERVASFWGDGVDGCPELLVIADRASSLGSPDIKPILSALRGKSSFSDVKGALLSESDADRAAIVKRLKALSSRRTVRTRYAALLETVWNAVLPIWTKQGRPLVTAAVRDWSRRMGLQGNFEAVLPQAHIYFHYPERVASIGDKPVFLAPCYFASLGGHVVDTPTTLAIAAAAGPIEMADTVRAEARHLAPKLKVLGDPTRLAMLLILSHENRTISELTRRLSVTQPTISGHMKALRDEGLVDSVKEGGRVFYRASKPALEGLVREASRALAVGERKPG